MRVSILSPRDTFSNVELTLSFNVTFGPPSRVWCVYIRTGQAMKIAFLNVRDDNTQFSRKIIRSYYGGILQPDMTRASIKVEQPIKEERTYECEVTVEGRVNIVNGTYTLDNKGSGITAVTVTGE